MAPFALASLWYANLNTFLLVEFYWSRIRAAACNTLVCYVLFYTTVKFKQSPKVPSQERSIVSFVRVILEKFGTVRYSSNENVHRTQMR